MTRILVIEDEGPLREEVVDMLRFEGFDTLEADDGQEGLRLALEHVPDLVISDITMPKLDGYQVLLELRAQPKTSLIPFIFLTARSDKPFMRHGMELGADDYLTKPFTRAELLTAIEARLERHRALAGERSQQLEHAKALLIQMVAHELRTPLVSVLMVQEVISRQIGQLVPAQVQDLFDILDTGSKRLAHLVEQMVYITELESGVLSPENIQEHGQTVQLWQVLTGAIDLGRQFAYRHRDREIRFQERDREAMVVADLRALKHALAELVSNALNFTPPGKEIVISAWQAEGQAWISVFDQGSGMSADQVERVFDEFYQVNRQTHEQQGIGLGLSLACRIIEVHGGALALNSVVGKGTQVTISLPLLTKSRRG